MPDGDDSLWTLPWLVPWDSNRLLEYGHPPFVAHLSSDAAGNGANQGRRDETETPLLGHKTGVEGWQSFLGANAH